MLNECNENDVFKIITGIQNVGHVQYMDHVVGERHSTVLEWSAYWRLFIMLTLLLSLLIFNLKKCIRWLVVKVFVLASQIII